MRKREAAGPVAEWERSLAEAGPKLPEGWEKMTTDQIRTEYVNRKPAKAGPPPTGPASDPDLKGPDD
ncbi:hypothetical protein ACH4A8_04220 [Streptomyces vietnamensis]|uniref:hypothetical protein n=1 Tax=Streptomyces vietnamensis TaxID=362257 RepID=UPI0037A0EC86